MRKNNLGVFKRFIYWKIVNLSRRNSISRKILVYSTLAFYTVFFRNKEFQFNNKKYKYFYHSYNRTLASERVIEIPIIADIVKKSKGNDILEIGNVLSHYFPSEHEIIDKYEKAKNVYNEDVVKFKFQKKYDIIVSISTLEHVGWDYDEDKDETLFLKGINNVIKHLKKGGLFVITVPVDFRVDIREKIKRNKLPFQKEYFMKRKSFLNEWVQVDRKTAIDGIDYDKGYANSNAIYIGFYKK